jgi:rSAM/selenodomain-associated transferase 1
MAVEHSAPIVAVFTRGCERGRVKSRLARTVGEDVALDTHRALLRHTFDAVERSGLAAEVWLDGAADSLPSHAFDVRAQPFGDLGARMHGAIADIVARRRAAILVGSDCPLLDAAYLQRAATLLARADVVIGPVDDGGYVLIGMHAAHPALFTAMPWSTSAVYAETLRRVGIAQLRSASLEPLWDVDDEAGWRRWQALRAAATADRRSSRSSE